MSSGIKLPDLVIANAAQLSNVLGRQSLTEMDAITFFAPATLPETVNPQISPKDGSVDADFVNLQIAGADVVLVAGKALELTDIAWKELRLRATAPVAAQRTIGAVGAERGHF
jgi:hypothetical protein